jgi:hypothetical protein
MKLNLKGKLLLDLDGRPLEGTDMSMLVGQALVSGTEGDAVKQYELALRLRAGEVDLDTSDAELVERLVRDSNTLTVLAKGQILLELKKAK